MVQLYATLPPKTFESQDWCFEYYFVKRHGLFQIYNIKT
jgi:hypothetical protein